MKNMMTKNSFCDGLFIQLTGMSGAGKSTLAKKVSKELQDRGYRVEIIDGDVYRENLCSDLGFSEIDRRINIQRLSFVGKLLARNGVIVIMSAINPFEDLREKIKNEDNRARIVYVKCDLDELVRRDVKGLYARALLPPGNPRRIEDFTGISSPYYEPANPDLTLYTQHETTSECAERLLEYIMGEIE